MFFRALAVLTLLAMNPAFAEFFPGHGPQYSGAKAGLETLASADERLLDFETKMANQVTVRGGNLRIVLEPSNMRVNARAKREGKDWMIVVYGGMIAQTVNEPAALSLVLCHELGHHLGGEPFAARGGVMSTEGQADYWSTLACFKQLHTEQEAPQAALYLTSLYASQNMGPAPQLESHDATVVPRTFYGYPSPQCRLDTLLAGLAEAPRPACWFHSN